MSDTPSRLMLVSPVLGVSTDFLPALEAALGSAAFAAVVLRVEREAEERALLKTLKPLVEAVQNSGAAALIDGAPDLVGKSGADGIHALGVAQTKEAAERFKPEKIVGAGGLRTRDEAMTAGETNCDYVLFGDPGKGGTPPAESVAERCDWWAEIFNTPCVGQAETLDAVAPIAATDAEFVALGSFVWTHPEGPDAAVRTALEAMRAEQAA